MIRYLLCDLDGTLADTDEANFRAYQSVFARHGVTLDRERFASFRGQPVERFGLVEAALLPEIKAHKARTYLEMLPFVRPNTRLLAFLDGQRSTQSLAVVTTAARANAEAVLDQLGIRSWFKVLVTGDDVRARKPDPEAYLHCLSQLGARPEECLVLEDSPAGLQAAARAGLAVLPVAPF